MRNSEVSNYFCCCCNSTHSFAQRNSDFENELDGTIKVRHDMGAPPIYRIAKTIYTVKLGNKERFDKELIGIKEPFPVTNLPFTS